MRLPREHFQILVKEEIMSLYPINSVFEDSSSPQYLSLQWVLNEDQYSTCIRKNNLVQRYVLGVLYFETNGSDWLSCSQRSGIYCDGVPFLSAVDECKWEGILCWDKAHVIGIHLVKNNLRGTLPPELSLLKNLKELAMDENNLSGKIPPELGNLTFLEVIDIDNNEFTGSIPDEIFSVTSLQVLDLDNNSFSGTLSTLLGNLPELYFLQLDKNNFRGGVPTELSSLVHLKYLSLFASGTTEVLSSDFCGKDLTLYADCKMCPTEDCCTACLDKK